MDVKAEINARILACMDELIANGVVENTNQFYFRMGMHPQGGTQIKNGTRAFTLQQIYTLCHTFKVNPNYIFGISLKKFRK